MLEIPLLHHTVILDCDKRSLKLPKDELMRIGVEASLEVCEYANALGVRTVTENQGFVVNGVEGYNEFIKMTGGKIGMLLDVGNIAFVDETAEQLLRGVTCTVEHVHIKDYILSNLPRCNSYISLGGRYITDCEIGTGDIRLERIAKLLNERNYDGYYSLEFPADTHPDSVERVIARVRGIVSIQ